MATTELTTATLTHRKPRLGELALLTVRVYATLWLITLAAAAAVATAGLTSAVRGLLHLSLSPHATPAPSAVACGTLALHNLGVCGWPLLLAAAGATRSRRATVAATALVAGSLTANTALVGAALGAYGARLVPYIPQLPLEWLALATGAAGWLTPRARGDPYLRRVVAGALLALVLAAGAIETCAVPHASQRGVRGAVVVNSRGVRTRASAT